MNRIRRERIADRYSGEAVEVLIGRPELADAVLAQQRSDVRVVTHPRVFNPPTPLAKALEEIDRLFDAPAITLLGEGPGHRAHLRSMVTAGRATGNVAHDAHIAALLREHAVREFWTTDKDFHRFPGIPVRNPFTTDAVHETRVKYKTQKAAAHRALGSVKKQS